MSRSDRGAAVSSRLAIVVNAAGLQERRAAALQDGLGRLGWEARVSVAPGLSEIGRVTRWSDIAYVIDPGRRGFPAGLFARLAPRAASVIEIGDPQAALYAAQARSKAAVALGGALDAMSVRAADHLVFRGADLAATLRVRGPWTFVPDGVDTAVFRFCDATTLRGSLGFPEDALVAGVVGSISWADAASWAYGLDIIEALARTPSSVHGLIVGDGDGLDHLRRRASELEVSDRVVFCGRRPHSEIPLLLSAMDVCVSTQSDDEIGRGRTTAKLPEYLACDRYVLASAVGTAAELLPEGMLLPALAPGTPEQVRALSARLTELVDHRGDLRAGAGTRAIALREFSYEQVVAAVDDVLRSVLAR